MDGMTFAEVRSLANNGYPSWLTEGEARWIDAMPERPLMSEVADLPEVVFRPLFSDVLTYGPDHSYVKAFREIFKPDIRHPHLKAAKRLLLTINRVHLVDDESELCNEMTNAQETKWEILFAGADQELYHSVVRFSDFIRREYSEIDFFIGAALSLDSFPVTLLFHGFRSNHKIREWLGKNPEVQGALNTFSQTVYGEDW